MGLRAQGLVGAAPVLTLPQEVCTTKLSPARLGTGFAGSRTGSAGPIPSSPGTVGMLQEKVLASRSGNSQRAKRGRETQEK